MDSIKSYDYLVEIVQNIGKDEAIDVVQNISYLLADNGYHDARYFTDSLMDAIENM